MAFFKKLLGKTNKTRQDHPLLSFAKKLSNNNIKVTEAVSLYCGSPKAYFDQIDEDIREDCFIETPDDIRPSQVLVTALYENNCIAIVDNRSEPVSVLESINELSNLKLKSSELYPKVEELYKGSKYGFGSFLGSIEHSPTIFECAKSVGLRLLSINDDSDAIVMFFCYEEETSAIIQLANEAGIRLYFENI